MEHDKHPTADRAHAPIQGSNARKRLVVLQPDLKDCFFRHNRFGPVNNEDAEIKCNIAFESKLRRARIRFTVLLEQHELDADRLLVLLRHDHSAYAD